MYIRVKRNKSTYFINCNPTETVLNIKQKVHSIIDQPPNNQRLILLATNNILDDLKTLADQKVPKISCRRAHLSSIHGRNYVNKHSTILLVKP
jgi:hypothetical protein